MNLTNLDKIDLQLNVQTGKFYYIDGNGQFTEFSIPQSVQNGYTSYVANLVQSGTDAPVITELYNGTGATITSVYDNIGSYYLLASSNIFTSTNTFVMINQTGSDTVSAQKDPNSSNKILINVSAGNDILNGSIEVRVYN